MGTEKHLTEGRRTVLENKFFSANVGDTTYEFKVLKRIGAKAKRFSDVNFSRCIFTDSYFRNCTFENCNFTGTVFNNSNFRGTKFINCTFDYAEFFRSRFEAEIFACKPNRENICRDFARRLKMNFRGLGEKEMESKAVQLELDSNEKFLFKSWSDGDQQGYYRRKYIGQQRFFKFVEWIVFVILKYVWGNGESFKRLAFTFATAIALVIAVTYVFRVDQTLTIKDSIVRGPFMMFGAYKNTLPEYWNAIILVVRLVLFGLLISMIIKKWTFK